MIRREQPDKRIAHVRHLFAAHLLSHRNKSNGEMMYLPHLINMHYHDDPAHG